MNNHIPSIFFALIAAFTPAAACVEVVPEPAPTPALPPTEPSHPLGVDVPPCVPAPHPLADPVGSLAFAMSTASEHGAAQPQPTGTHLYDCQGTGRHRALALTIWSEDPSDAQAPGVVAIALEGASLVTPANIFRGRFGGTTYQNDDVTFSVACLQFAASINEFEEYAFFAVNQLDGAQIEMACTSSSAP